MSSAGADGEWGRSRATSRRASATSRRAWAFTRRCRPSATRSSSNTVIRWNEYLNASAIESNRRRLARSARETERNAAATEGILKRLRDNPEDRDLASGDALNIALQEIDNPKVYRRALKAAGVKIGGDTVRKIPFRYAAAAIEIGIHHLAAGNMPRALLGPEFEADRQKLKALDQALLDQVDEDKDPDPAIVKKLLEEIYAFEEKSSKVLTGSTLERTQAERYLKALHGLVAMLNAPAARARLGGRREAPRHHARRIDSVHERV